MPWSTRFCEIEDVSVTCIHRKTYVKQYCGIQKKMLSVWTSPRLLIIGIRSGRKVHPKIISTGYFSGITLNKTEYLPKTWLHKFWRIFLLIIFLASPVLEFMYECTGLLLLWVTPPNQIKWPSSFISGKGSYFVVETYFYSPTRLSSVTIYQLLMGISKVQTD